MKFKRIKCCQIGTYDIGSTTALIKRYVFGIVGYYIFAQKSKKNQTRHDNKNIPLYKCGCGV